MVDKEMLSAMEELLDKKLDEKLDEKLQPIYDRLDTLEEDVHCIKVVQLENNVIPRLDAVEEDVHCIKVVQLENNVIPRLDTVEEDVHCIKVVQLENNVIPRLGTIESCYSDTYKRYQEKNEKMDAAFQNIEVLNQVVGQHSERLLALEA